MVIVLHVTWILLLADEERSFLETAETVELSRRLLQILNKSDPMEAEEELKKLKEELNARSMYTVGLGEGSVANGGQRITVEPCSFKSVTNLFWNEE